MAKEDDLIKLIYPKFWNKRYTSEQRVGEDGAQELGSYEWFRDFEELRPFFVKQLLAPCSSCHILHLGCGNSTLTANLYALGYTNQTSVDFSQVVIDSMESKYSQLVDTRWCVMDLRRLELPDGSVDIAIDKATLDGMTHGSIWNPPEDVRSNVGKYVDEVARVLKPGGMWLYITYRQPHFMKPMLERKFMDLVG